MRSLERSFKKLFESSFFRIYKWAVSNLHFVMNVLQVHVLNTLFVLLEALLPCLQKAEEDHPVKKPVEKKKKQIERDSDDEDEEEEEKKCSSSGSGKSAEKIHFQNLNQGTSSKIGRKEKIEISIPKKDP